MHTTRHGAGDVPHFRDIVGHDPYPWQRALYAGLLGGEVPDAVRLPTGLGKTACVLLLLLARVQSRSLPTRIVYVVDRRAIVDQTAETVRGWVARIAALPALARAFDACAAFAAEHPVGLGVLRGGLADDGAWRADPARPTVVVGTVDMVGSRLLFAGYGDGRSRRAMHAGLLGHDAVVVLDEAHLAPAMAALLDAVAGLAGGRHFRTLALSATGASPARGTVLGLGAADFRCAAVRRRLDAPKSVRIEQAATGRERIARLCHAASAHRTGAIAVFVERVADARRIASRLIRALGAGGGARVALLTGTLRGHERAALAGGAVWGRFRPGRARGGDAPPVVLVMTAAGEVGVDLDADHAVMDLSTLDSMIQRIGRVNRAGAGEATVTVVCTEREARAETRAPRTARERRDAARGATLGVLRALPDVSPATLDALDAATLARCTATGVRPARLDAAVLEAYAATSAEMALPPVAVYLRGVAVEPEPPETFLAWRFDVEALAALGAGAARAALAFHRPRPRELARVPTPFARTLIERALARADGGGLALVVAGARGEVFAGRIDDAAALPALGFATVVLAPGAGGLAASGVPDPEAAAEVADVADDAARIRYVEGPGDATDPASLPRWVSGAMALRIPLAPEGERCLVYARRRPGAGRAGGESGPGWLGVVNETVDAHCARVAQAARRIGEALALPAPLVDALAAAGAWHDRGKARAPWQRAAGVPPGAAPPLAKTTRATFRPGWLAGYRHEFGSLADAERALDPEVPHRDLILHLVAAHHGWARPSFPDRAQWDPEDTACANEARAVRAAHRFATVQARYGPWRLAWLEALVKAADAHVSSTAPG